MCVCFLVFFKTGFPFTVLTSLEFALQTKLVSNSQNTGIKGVYHHHLDFNLHLYHKVSTLGLLVYSFSFILKSILLIFFLLIPKLFSPDVAFCNFDTTDELRVLSLR